MDLSCQCPIHTVAQWFSSGFKTQWHGIHERLEQSLAAEMRQAALMKLSRESNVPENYPKAGCAGMRYSNRSIGVGRIEDERYEGEVIMPLSSAFTPVDVPLAI